MCLQADAADAHRAHRGRCARVLCLRSPHMPPSVLIAGLSRVCAECVAGEKMCSLGKLLLENRVARSCFAAVREPWGCKDYMACFGVFLVSCEVCVRGQFCLENAFARAQSLKFSSARDEAALAKNLSLRGDRARKAPIIFAAPPGHSSPEIGNCEKKLSALAGCYAHAWRHRSSLCSMQTNLEKSREANIFSGSRAGE